MHYLFGIFGVLFGSLTAEAGLVACKAQYYCQGDKYIRGTLNSTGVHWDMPSCLQNLQSQARPVCGTEAYLIKLTYSDPTVPAPLAPLPSQIAPPPVYSGGGTASGCRSNYNYWVALAVTEGGGMGTSSNKYKEDAENAAIRVANKHGPAIDIASIQGGCVAYAFSRTTWRSYIRTACSRADAENKALNACRGECRVKDSECAL